MRGITISKMIELTGGRWIGPAELPEAEAEAVVTDSRKLTPGAVFAALRGEHSDGHDFVCDVLERGALCCIVEKEVEGAERLIVVESCMAALGAIAAFYRRILDIPVVGITGSVGKTSTKEMIASVLSRRFKVHKTDGNFNNELGLPLSIFGIGDEDEIAVLEMGISGFGEMSRLSAIARPDVMVITNIGPCHLEFLGDLDGVFAAKTECFENLGSNPLVVLNGDDPHLAKVTPKDIKASENPRVAFYGRAEDKELAAVASDVRLLGVRGAEIKGTLLGENFTVKEPLPGEHNVYNVLAALIVGRHFGMSVDEMREGVAEVPVMPGRNHVITLGPVTVFDDCYNANPESMRAALSVLSRENGRTVAILGDMGELGEDESLLHSQVGEYAGKCDIDIVYTVGELSYYLAQGLRRQNQSVRCRSFDKKEDLYPVIKKEIKDGDTILVKASRFMRFEDIVEFLSNEYSGGEV